MIYHKNRRTTDSRLKSERKRACLDRLYDCPSVVDEQQLKDLHINCYGVEE